MIFTGNYDADPLSFDIFSGACVGLAGDEIYAVCGGWEAWDGRIFIGGDNPGEHGAYRLGFEGGWWVV